MSEVIDAAKAMLQGFVKCEQCGSYPVVTIKDRFAQAKCQRCGAHVEVIGFSQPFGEVRDWWNKQNGMVRTRYEQICQ